MSKFEGRLVPVVLQAGKKYVRRDGVIIKIEDNPHWQCSGLFPFFDEDNCVYYTSSGHVDVERTEHTLAIARPSYEVGETYVLADGRTQIIKSNTQPDDIFKIRTEDGWTYSIDGSYWGDPKDPGPRDLLDYSAAPAVVEVPTVDANIGRKVHVNYAGEFIGTIVAPAQGLPGYYAVHIDERIRHHGGHNCDGLVSDGNGWHVPLDCMTDYVAPEPVTPGIAPPHADEALLEELGVPPVVEIKPEDYIGKRVYCEVVQCEGIIRCVKDNTFFGVEFPDYNGSLTLHYLDGNITANRGWYVYIHNEGNGWALVQDMPVHPDFVVPDAVALPLNDGDRAAIWHALAERVSTLKEPHIGEILDELIVARRKLNAT